MLYLQNRGYEYHYIYHNSFNYLFHPQGHIQLRRAEDVRIIQLIYTLSLLFIGISFISESDDSQCIREVESILVLSLRLLALRPTTRSLYI